MALSGRASKTEVVLVSPGNPRAIYQGLGDDVAAIEPPVWAGMLANFLRSKAGGGRSVRLVDQVGEGLASEAIAGEVRDARPRLAGIVVYGQQPSASTQTMTAALALVDAIKAESPATPVILIGGHPSALPRETLRESAADFVCKGEGPATLAGLLALSDLRDTNALARIPGLCFRDGAETRLNPEAPLIAERELTRVLPGVAWDLLPMRNYRAHNWHCFDHIDARQPYASLYTSLGCPYRCSFCCINAPFGRNTIRCWDPNFVVDEMEKLARDYGVRNLKIVDEMFVLKEKHVEAVCDGILARGLDFNIWAYARVDTVKPRLLEKMRRAGFRWLCLGIESGSKHVRDGVQKGRFGSDDIRTVVDTIHAAGIHIIGNYIFGLPDDDWDSLRATLDLAFELNLEFANFYSAMAYPGSELYHTAKTRGWELPKRWQDFSQHAFETLPLPTEKLAAGEVLAFRDYAWKAYFTNPAYLELVGRKFGAQVLAHLAAVAKHDLPRKHALSLADLPVRALRPRSVFHATV